MITLHVRYGSQKKDAISLDESLTDKTNTTANSIPLWNRYNVLLTCSYEHRMMIHEYHRIIQKTKTRQGLMLKTKTEYVCIFLLKRGFFQSYVRY